MKHKKKEYEQIISNYKKTYKGDNIAFLLKDKPFNTIKKINEIKCQNPDRIISEYLPNDKIIIHDEIFTKLLIEKGESIKSFNRPLNEAIVKTDLDNNIIKLISNKTTLLIKMIENNHMLIDSEFFVYDAKYTDINDLIFNYDTNVIINANTLNESDFIKIVSHKWIFNLNREKSIRLRVKRFLQLKDEEPFFKKRIIPKNFKEFFKSTKTINIVDEIAYKHDLYTEDIYKAIITNRLHSFLHSVFYDRIYKFLEFVNNKYNYNTLLDIILNTKVYDYKIKFFCSLYCKIHSDEINEDKHINFVNFYNNICKKINLPCLDLLINMYNGEGSANEHKTENLKLKILTRVLILDEITTFGELKNYLYAEKIRPIDFLEYEKNNDHRIKEIVLKIEDLLEKKSKLNPFISNIIYISRLNEGSVFQKSYDALFLLDLISFKNSSLFENITYDFYSSFSIITNAVQTKSFSQAPISYLIKSVHDMIFLDDTPKACTNCEHIFNFFFTHIHENNSNSPFFNLRNNPYMCAYLLLYFQLIKEVALYNSILSSFISLDYDMKSISYFLDRS